MKKLLGALVTLSLSVVFVGTVYGDNIKALFGMTADALAGDTLVEKRVSRSREGALEKKTLQNFGQENDGYGGSAPYVPTVAAPNPTTLTAADAKSTFAIDVDTASWGLARRLVMKQSQLPSASDVRVEEWVNAFDFRLAAPTKDPVAITVDGANSPWNESKTVVRVALKAQEVAQREPAHLVFLVDTSGSMSSADRLPLAVRALTVLTHQLRADDTVSIVTYAGSTEVVLEPTSAAKSGVILDALAKLQSGGGTAMASGMELAYRLAVRQVRPHTTTRVIVLTDGDANIGTQSPQGILDAVHGYVEEGVTLTTVGFGMGNYRGVALEQLADKGNGQALYIGEERDLQTVFNKNLTGTLQVVAKDVKVQVTFDPEVVSSYRLLGYENRAVADQDFTNDKVDAGELGAGHAVTALYEVKLTSKSGALGTVAVRGQRPNGEVFQLEQPMTRASVSHALSETPADLRFATAVALGADTLRGNPVNGWSLESIAELAAGATVESDERVEFVQFLRRAQQLRGMPVAFTQTVSNQGY